MPKGRVARSPSLSNGKTGQHPRRWPSILMQTSNVVSPWLTSDEAASYLKVSPRTIVHWARIGQIKGHILSGTERITWRFLQSDLDAMLTPPSVGLTRRTQ